MSHSAARHPAHGQRPPINLTPTPEHICRLDPMPWFPRPCTHELACCGGRGWGCAGTAAQACGRGPAWIAARSRRHHRRAGMRAGPAAAEAVQVLLPPEPQLTRRACVRRIWSTSARPAVAVAPWRRHMHVAEMDTNRAGGESGRLCMHALR